MLLDNASSHIEPKKQKENNNEINESDETSAAESSHAIKTKKEKVVQLNINNIIVSKEDIDQKLNLLEAINCLSDAWSDVPQNTISNCWTKAEIFPSVDHIRREVASDQIDIELDAEFEEIEELLEILPDTATPFLDDINNYTKELPAEEFLEDKQIIEYVSKEKS